MALYSIETEGRLEPHLSREWLLTNGIGGYAASSIVGCNTRRYHGLLVAATLPPVGRVMALARLGEIFCVGGDESRLLEFSINQFANEFHPRGDRYLRRFELNDAARFEYDVEGIHVVKEVRMAWMRNVVGVRYTVDPGGRGNVEMRLMPFVGLRDFHGIRRGERHIGVEASEEGARFSGEGATLHLRTRDARFVESPQWWFGHEYAIDRERGQEHVEDLLSPGRFVRNIEGKTTITLWASMEAIELPDWDGEIARGAAAKREARAGAGDRPSITIQRLLRAADDFVVPRKDPEGRDGATLLAGYPWFADWGRDTFISLPGLLLATKRFRQAREVLTVYAKYVSEGMIPNRFDDYTSAPSYNTVDASLWFIHAAYEYLRMSGDRETFDSALLGACGEIVEGYRRGTRYGIRMDPEDGLVTQGDSNTQLTWMDAKFEGRAFTPRQGKAVEINALWYNALRLMKRDDLADRVGESFRRVYWQSPFRGLCDVVDGDRRDTAIRPNQIFAVSLPHSPLTREQRGAVVEVVRRELLTPVGLRTLSPGDPNYHPRYTGPQALRDEAYHNGTVWPWLMGPFLESHLRVHERSAESIEQARRWLSPLIEHLVGQGCIGQIAEVFDGDAPHRPGGCCAQAWSVAETLRLAMELGM